jgi:aspartate racemase
LLERHGYDVIVPDPGFQNNVIHRIIYDKQFGIKANPNNITPEAAGLMKKAISFFKEQGGELLILGCTELPVMLAGKKEVEGMAVVNSIEAMALALIKEAAVRSKEQTGSFLKK